jgi:hypothetical protein
MLIMKRKLLHPFVVISLVLFSAAVLQGCSKGSSGSNNSADTSSYYLSATLGGKAWNSNVYFDTYKSNVIGGITTVNGIPYVEVIGLYASNGDTSQALTIVFPQDIPLNTPITLDSVQYKDVVYVSEDPLRSGKFDAYNTATPTGGSGTMTITTFDQTNQILAGAFSGVFGSDTNTKPGINFTNGKFRCPYILEASQLPPAALKY